MFLGVYQNSYQTQTPVEKHLTDPKVENIGTVSQTVQLARIADPSFPETPYAFLV